MWTVKLALISALTMEEEDVFKTSKWSAHDSDIQNGGRWPCECDFRHIPVSRRYTFSETYQTQIPPTVLKNLWSLHGLPCNYAVISNGNQYCLNKHTYFLPAPILLLLLLLLSRFSRVRLCATPETTAHQAPPSLGFSRQEHWSGFPFPSPMHESEKWKGSRSVVSDVSGL